MSSTEKTGSPCSRVLTGASAMLLTALLLSPLVAWVLSLVGIRLFDLCLVR